MTMLVHCNKDSFDVNIGRPSIWGNPYTHIADRDTLAEFIVGTRDEAISKYREYLINNEELMGKLHELEGKTLGCWCVKDSNDYPIPYVCHGQVIIELLNQRKLQDFFKKR